MKIIKDYQRFFKTLATASIQYDLDVFYLVWSVATAPTVLFNPKIEKDVAKRLNKTELDTQTSVMKYVYDYTLTVMKGHLPEDPIIESIYRNFLKDYNAHEYKYKDVIDDFNNDRDMTKHRYPPLEWWVADTVFKLKDTLPQELKENIAAQLRQLLGKEREKEIKLEALTEEDRELFSQYGGFVTLFDQFIYNQEQNPELQNVGKADAIAKLLKGTKIGDHYLFGPLQMDFLHYLYKMVYNTAGEAVDVTKEYKQQVDSILKKYDKVKREVSEFKNENESLIRKVAELESKLSKFQYASKALALNKQLHQQVDTQQVQIDELSAKLAELKDENEMLKEIAQSEPPASVSYQNKPKAIVYFGLENPDLEQEFKKQEIEFITLSPFTKPDHIPEGFIVINVDFAKHTVWEVIKYHKPIIVTGSNGKLLSEKILAFCG